MPDPEGQAAHPLWRHADEPNWDQQFASVDFTIGNRHYDMTPASHDGRAPLAIDAAVEGVCGGLPFSLPFSQRAGDALLASRLPGAVLKLDGSPADALFVTHVMTPVLSALERLGLEPIALDRVVPCTPDQHRARFDFRIVADGETQGVNQPVACDGRLALRIADAFTPQPGEILDALQLPAEVRLLAGFGTIETGDLPRLTPGAGLILDQAPVGENRLLVQVGEDQYLAARIDGSCAIVESDRPMKMPPPPQPLSSPSVAKAPNGPSPVPTPPIPGGGALPPKNGAGSQLPEAGPASFAPKQASDPAISTADIPIRITCEVGRYELTVKEIGALRPGARFDLTGDPREFVTIRANGQVIGTGEIVQAGQKLAVRIKSLKS